MLLIICYASWRVIRATRQRAAGEIETGATAFKIDERIQEEGGEGEREREGGGRARKIPIAMHFDRSRTKQHDFEL